MNHWQVGDHVFDANTHRLSCNGRNTLLEPKAAALLAYFCEHPGRDIGRDELLEAVWHGQIVADNSINRVIVLLRKALNDEDTPRRYIATVPKLGYRFIAVVSAIERSATKSPVAPTNKSLRPSFAYGFSIAGVVAVVAIGAIYYMQGKESNARPSRLSVEPLSRLATAQYNANLAGDGQSLLYTASDGRFNQVYLVAGTATEPQPISEPGGDANFAAWAAGDEFVVYQYMGRDRCEFHRVDRDQLGARSAQVLHECRSGSYTELLLSPDNQTLYFLERATPFAPYAVYAIDLERQSKRRLSQPVASGYGNHFIDVHPHSGDLLLLSDHAPGKTSLYILDPNQDSFALLRQMDYSLDSAIWSHRDGYVVHPSMHPSYELLETSLESGISRVILSDSRRISNPRRIRPSDENNHDYLFTSYLNNRDIEVAGYPGAPFNSAVMDYLPTISNDGQRLAFVSKRSGDSEIWLLNIESGGLTSIRPPDEGRRFHDLVWSSDDQQLLANTNTGVLVYSLATKSYTRDLSLSQSAYATQWYDANTLTYSHFEDGRWQAYRHHLPTGEIEPLDARWAFVAQTERGELTLDQELRPYLQASLLVELEACARPIWRYQLRYRFDRGAIYCHATDGSNDLLRYDADLQVTRIADAVSRYEFFSVRDGRLAKTRVASSHSDIMRTRRAN